MAFLCYNWGMRYFVLSAVVAVMFVFPLTAQAEIDNSTLDITQSPICFAVKNEANYNITGNFASDYYWHPRGQAARHRSNFRLAPMGSRDPETGEYSDRKDFCSTGPFLPDRQMTMTLRTLFPVFECKTRIDSQQYIVIKGERNASDTGVITWAECFKADGTKMTKQEALDR